LLDRAKIVLSGGVTWDNVLFNVRGSGHVTLGGESSLQGILMANNRTVKIGDKPAIMGEVIANKVVLRGGSQIMHPPVVSP
jgi:cytoskeletal protein CcmA (bactofilin family)